MNIGELRMQNIPFDSQLQLNNDLLISKKESISSFDEILKKKATNRSVGTDEDVGRYKGMTNVTMNKNARDHFNNRIGVDFSNKSINQANGLKKQINGDIAQNKFVKTEDKINLSKSTKSKAANTIENIEAKLKALEDAIKDELGLNVVVESDQEKVLVEIAALLGIDMSELEVLLSDQALGDEKEANTIKLVELILEKPEVIELIAKELESLVALENKEVISEFSDVLTQVINGLPEGDEKEQLQALVEQIEQVEPESQTAAKVESNQKNVEVQVASEQIQSSDNKKVSVQTEFEQITSEFKEELEEVKVEAKTKTGEQPEFSQTSKGETSGKSETKVISDSKLSFDEQVSVMKDQNTLISSAKVDAQPKVMLARSVMNQIVQGTKMSVNLSENGSEILIKLNPKNLGNVALKMSFEKGVLLAQINVENQTVKALIESNLEDLKNALKDEGYMIGDLDVSVNKENTGGQNEGFEQNSNNKVDSETFEEVEEKVLNEKQRLVSNKEIDYFA